MSRARGVVGVMLVVVLAGCFGVAPGGDRGDAGASTATGISDTTQQVAGSGPGPERTDNRERPATTANGRSMGPPAGISNNRLVDGRALVRAHLAAVNGTSYRSSARDSATVDGSTNTLVSRVRANASATLAVFDASRIVNRTTFTTPAGQYVRVDHGVDPTVTYRERGSGEIESDYRDVAVSAGVEHVLEKGRFVVEKTVTRDGTRYYRLRATTAAPSAENVTAFNATLLVRQDGVIQELTATYTIASESGPRRGESTFEWRPVENRTVDPPSWASGNP